jgi:hypothetical protein
LLFINARESIMTAFALHTLEALDNLDRFTSQAQAVVKCLLANDHFKDLSPKLVADSLWLVMDRLNDIGNQLDVMPANQLPAEQDTTQPEIPPRPYMIRTVVTNIPGWWLGETPVIEYEAAIWAAGGNIHRQQFKTHDEAEAWAKGSDYHG